MGHPNHSTNYQRGQKLRELVAGGGVGEGAADEHGVEKAIAVGDALERLIAVEGAGVDGASAVEIGSLGFEGAGPIGKIVELILEKLQGIAIGVGGGGDAGLGHVGLDAVAIFLAPAAINGGAVDDHGAQDALPFANI